MQNSVQPLENNDDNDKEDWDNSVYWNSNEAGKYIKFISKKYIIKYIE